MLNLSLLFSYWLHVEMIYWLKENTEINFMFLFNVVITKFKMVYAGCVCGLCSLSTGQCWPRYFKRKGGVRMCI